MSFTEFYCNASTGSNLNSGSTETAAVFSGVGDSDGTSIFTPSDGQTPASTVSVGMFGALYVTSGAAVAAFVGRITVVAAGVNGAVTFSTTAKSGTFPAASSGAHTITLVVGGPWKGPNGTSGFPMGFTSGSMTNSSSDPPRVNLKNNATYSITAAITESGGNGPVIYQGYTSTVNDAGKFTLDGGTSGTSYTLITMSQPAHHYVDAIFQNNGATGNAVAFNATNSRATFTRCVFNSLRGIAFQTNGGAVLIECEAYSCNQSNGNNVGTFQLGGSNFLYRCIAHDNGGSTGNSSAGFTATGTSALVDCISESNTGNGFSFASGIAAMLKNCDAYNNTQAGANVAGTYALIENCNFLKNGTYGVLGSNAIAGHLLNCGFGSGTQTNTSGTTSAISGIVESGTVTYASGVTPWVDPANGDFRINLAAAKGAGRGTFTQTATSYAGTIGYPDIGAAQHLESSAVIVIDDE